MVIPNFFYQSWDEALPRVIHSKNIKQIPPHFIYKCFSLKDIRIYLSANWPHVIELYDSYTIIPHKVDLWRYCILYDTGGIYMDADSLLVNSIEPLLECDYFFVSNNIGKKDVFNGFLGTYPHNPIYLSMINFMLTIGVTNHYLFNCEYLYTLLSNDFELIINKNDYIDKNNFIMFILWDKQHLDSRFYAYYNNLPILVETNPYYPYKKKVYSTNVSMQNISIQNMSIQNISIQNISIQNISIQK